MKRGCYKLNPNSIRQRIEDMLIEHGGMTISEMMEELTEHTKGGVSKIVCEMRDAGTIYISDWEMTQPGQKRHPRPVWDHASHSKRQPPVNKHRPMPTSNAARLKHRRIRRADGSFTSTRYVFKMVKTPASQQGVEE